MTLALSSKLRVALLLGLSAWWVGAAAIGSSYTYYALDRVVAIINNDGTGETFAYDPAGNRAAAYSGHPTVFSLSPVAVNDGSVASFTMPVPATPPRQRA